MAFTKETLKRTLRTFLQAAVSYLVVSAATVDYSADGETLKSVLTGLAISSIAAGISAAMNLEEKEF